MSKDKHFIGQPIFGQLLNFVDKGDIRRLAKSQQADRYINKLDGLTHFITMLYAVLVVLIRYGKWLSVCFLMQPNYLI